MLRAIIGPPRHSMIFAFLRLIFTQDFDLRFRQLSPITMSCSRARNTTHSQRRLYNISARVRIIDFSLDAHKATMPSTRLTTTVTPPQLCWGPAFPRIIAAMIEDMHFTHGCRIQRCRGIIAFDTLAAAQVLCIDIPQRDSFMLFCTGEALCWSSEYPLAFTQMPLH